MINITQYVRIQIALMEVIMSTGNIDVRIRSIYTLT